MVTEDGFIRIICATFGMCVVDCWNSYRYHLPYNHRHKKCELMTVANMLAKDLLENLEDDTVEKDNQSLSIGVGRECREVQTPMDLMTCSSARTTISTLAMESGDAFAIRNLHVQLEVEKHRCVLTKHKKGTKRKRKNQRENADVEKHASRTGR